MGDAFASLYGIKASASLANLLTQHILQADKVVSSMDNADMLASAMTDWHNNATQISKLIYHYTGIDMNDMMHRHLNLTTAEADAEKINNMISQSLILKRY